LKDGVVKILNGKQGYKIADTSGYDYENSGSIEILSCIFNVDERTLVKKCIELNNNVYYYDFKDQKESNVDNYNKFYYDNESNITPFVTFSTYEKAEEILCWLENIKNN